jgi:TRAP-type mannitol/chloroaromatic compound transport system substrate-binding protein
MDRRKFLKTAGVAGTAAAASTTLAAPAISQGLVKLTMVTSWGRGLAGVHDAAQRLVDTVAAMTDGTMQIDLKAPGELIGALEVFDAVSSGQADAYHSADYYFVGQHAALGFFTSPPFGMTAGELNTWWYHMGGRELHDEVMDVFNMKPFLAGNTSSQGGGWFQKEITGPETFQGLKFRMPGLGGKALGYLGASVQNIPGGEIYQALSSGAIDGTEWIGPWADEKMGFQEVAKFYYVAGFHEPGSGLTFSVNKDVYDGLTPSQQKVLEIAAGACNDWNLAQFIANNGSALRRLISGGVIAQQFPASVWDALGSASNQVYEENMGDPLFKKVFESYRASMRESSNWLAKSDGVYASERNRVLGI